MMNPYYTYRNVFEFQKLDEYRLSNFLSSMQEYENWEKLRQLDRLIVGLGEKFDHESAEFKTQAEIKILQNRQRRYEYEQFDLMMQTDVTNLILWESEKKQNLQSALEARRNQVHEEYLVKSKRCVCVSKIPRQADS